MIVANIKQKQRQSSQGIFFFKGTTAHRKKQRPPSGMAFA
jgi:hypothetical protein